MLRSLRYNHRKLQDYYKTLVMTIQGSEGGLTLTPCVRDKVVTPRPPKLSCVSDRWEQKKSKKCGVAIIGERVRVLWTAHVCTQNKIHWRVFYMTVKMFLTEKKPKNYKSRTATMKHAWKRCRFRKQRVRDVGGGGRMCEQMGEKRVELTLGRRPLLTANVLPSFSSASHSANISKMSSS